MTKYRKKPIVVEAFQWTPDQTEDPDWFIDAMANGCAFFAESIPHTLKINTLEGVMNVAHGDYIIQGVNGEIYPCKPDIFYKTYDIVNSPKDNSNVG
jgi:hypothetical protein